MIEYTPTTEEVRTDYVLAYTEAESSQLLAGLAFDRWLAAHDAEVVAKTLEDAAKELRELDAPWQPHPIHWQYQVWLEARAAGIRSEL